MSKSSDISSRFWNQQNKAEEEYVREQTFIDDIVTKAHIERLLIDNLDGIETAFDGGAGYGRFSFLLAARGIKVVHFDISLPMIEKARSLAKEYDFADNITFVHGSLEDLSNYMDNEFDLVMSFDAPISYTYPNHEAVIKDLIRIAKKKIVISVYSRLAWTYQFDPAQKEKYILNKDSTEWLVRWTLDNGIPMRNEHYPNMNEVREFFETGLMEPVTQTEEAYENGGAPWPISYAFMPDELDEILTKYGAKNIKLTGPGVLLRSIPGEVLTNIMKDDDLKREFLDFCYWYDSNKWCVGMGKDNIVAIADL